MEKTYIVDVLSTVGQAVVKRQTMIAVRVTCVGYYEAVTLMFLPHLALALASQIESEFQGIVGPLPPEPDLAGEPAAGDLPTVPVHRWGQCQHYDESGQRCQCKDVNVEPDGRCYCTRHWHEHPRPSPVPLQKRCQFYYKDGARCVATAMFETHGAGRYCATHVGVSVFRSS